MSNEECSQKTFTDDELTLTRMYASRDIEQDVFCHAELTEEVRFTTWGKPPFSMMPIYHTSPKGTKVLITTISKRNGKIGIRDTDINTLKHGYTALVCANQVCNLKLI